MVLLETLAQAEIEDRTRRCVERRLRDACLGRFKSMTDWDWAWPKPLHRPTLGRVFTLDFLAKGEHVILVGAQGLGQTMLAKNLVHQSVLAGHSARFLTVADLGLDLNGQDTSRALERRLRAYARPHVRAIDEIGYLADDAHAADLLFQIVSRRYEQRAVKRSEMHLLGCGSQEGVSLCALFEAGPRASKPAVRKRNQSTERDRGNRSSLRGPLDSAPRGLAEHFDEMP